MSNVHTLTEVKDEERKALKKKSQEVANNYLSSAQLDIDEEIKRMVLNSSQANSDTVIQAFNVANTLTPMVAKAAVPALASHVKILQIGIECIAEAAQDTANELEIVSSQRDQLKSRLEVYESPEDVACMQAQLRQVEEQRQKQAPKPSRAQTTKLWLKRGVSRYLRQ